GLTSRETSFQGLDTVTASAMPLRCANSPGSSGPWLPVMPMATRVGPGISLGVKFSSRTVALTASSSSRLAFAFITISMDVPGASACWSALAAPFGGGDVALAAGLGHLLVDDLLEGLVGIGAADLAAVDEGG